MDEFMQQSPHQPIAGTIGIDLEAVLECVEPKGSNDDKRLLEAERIRKSTGLDDLPFHGWPDEPRMHVDLRTSCPSKGLFLGKLLGHFRRLELIVGHASVKKCISYLGLCLQGSFDALYKSSRFRVL